ncbi:MAG: hypothetical protein ACK4PG_08385 [Acetobacteraceae bacterium]
MTVPAAGSLAVTVTRAATTRVTSPPGRSTSRPAATPATAIGVPWPAPETWAASASKSCTVTRSPGRIPFRRATARPAMTVSRRPLCAPGLAAQQDLARLLVHRLHHGDEGDGLGDIQRRQGLAGGKQGDEQQGVALHGVHAVALRPVRRQRRNARAVSRWLETAPAPSSRADSRNGCFQPCAICSSGRRRPAMPCVNPDRKIARVRESAA